MRPTSRLALAALSGAAAALAVPAALRLSPAGADAPAQGPPDFAAVVERARPGVVHVWNFLVRPRDVPDPGDPASRNENVGSGFV